MALNTLQLLTLKGVPRVGDSSIFRIAKYIDSHHIDVNSCQDLLDAAKEAKTQLPKKETSRLSIPQDLSTLQNAESEAKNLIDYNAELGIKIVSYFDEAFPMLLRNTIDEDGKQSAPLFLYYKGDLTITQMPSIAIIGTREITPNGEKAGIFLSSEFAKRGFNIVSGLAIGCDTAGHRGALKVKGKTTAFLANGLDTVYPPENESLAKEIVEMGGLLMSENPAGTMVNRYNLVARDRLQAGLSLATLVIQTGIKGGTMHAAHATLKSNKPLYVVHFKDQYTNENEKTLGNAKLIEEGATYISGTDNLDEIASFIKGQFSKGSEMSKN